MYALLVTLLAVMALTGIGAAVAASRGHWTHTATRVTLGVCVVTAFAGLLTAHTALAPTYTLAFLVGFVASALAAVAAASDAYYTNTIRPHTR